MTPAAARQCGCSPVARHSLGAFRRPGGSAAKAAGYSPAPRHSLGAFRRPGGSAARAAGYSPAPRHSLGAFRRPGGSAAKAAGYTLIEVILAFAILALGLTLLLGTLSGATRQVRWAGETGRAALHAQSLLDDIGVGRTLQPGQRAGSFEDGRYRWTLAVTPYRDPLIPPDPEPVPPRKLGEPQLLQLELTVQWGEDNDPRHRLQLRSLRLVTPDLIAAGDAP